MDNSATRDQVLLVSGGGLAATIVSSWGAFFGADELDLEAILPWTGQDSVGGDDQVLATAILFAVPLIAALPLVFGRSRIVRVSFVSFLLDTGFVVISLIRVGLLYVPTAYMLGRVAWSNRGAPADSRAD